MGCGKRWHVSVKVDDNTVIATPTGISKSFITPEKLVTVDIDGNIIEAQEGYRPSSELKENRLKAYASVPDITEVCTGKHDLTVVSEYIAGKSVADISKTLNLSPARILDILDNVKRRCLWYGKHNK